MRKFLFLCMLVLGVGISAQIITNENFVGNSFPAGWTASAIPVNLKQEPKLPSSENEICQGEIGLSRQLDYNDQYSASSQSIIYSSLNSNAKALQYSFKYNIRALWFEWPKAKITVHYSIDGGSTWIEQGETIIYGKGGAYCKTMSGTIPAGAIPVGANFKFKITGSYVNGASFNFILGDVRLSQVPSVVPECTTLIEPQSGAVKVSLTPTFKWKLIPGASGYLVNVGTTPGGTDVLNQVNAGDVDSYTLPAAQKLIPSKFYYVKIIPFNIIGNSINCLESTFKTMPITCPSMVFPNYGMNENSSITPKFVWYPYSEFTGYKVSIQKEDNSYIIKDLDVGNVTSYQVTTPLAYDSQYFVTVNGYNAVWESYGCQIQKLSTIKLCPSVSLPGNNQTNTSLTPIFKWDAVPVATGYKISIGSTSGGTDILNNFDVGNVTSYTLPVPLDYNTKYFYTINSYNATLNSSNCIERTFTTLSLCPVISFPAPNAINMTVQPKITWSAATAGASGYKVSMGTSPGATDIMDNVDVGNVTSYSVAAPLEYNTKYYYTVKGYNGNLVGSNCSEQNFTTGNLCPVLYPYNETSRTPTIAWVKSSFATGYKISVGTTPGATDIINNVDVGNVSSYKIITPLAFDTQYYCRVVGYAGNKMGLDCTEVTLKVASLCPDLEVPQMNVPLVSVTPKLIWQPAIEAKGYKISIGTTPGGTDVINDESIVGNVGSYQITIPLAFNTKYYYKVTGHFGNVTLESCSKEKTFTTVGGCPNVLSPASDATNVLTTPLISWEAIAGVTGYKISMGTSAGGTDVMNNVDVGNVTSYTIPTPLALNTTYYYTVIAYSGNNMGTACIVRSFTTQGSCPVVYYPVMNATNQPLMPTINWHKVPTATSYALTIGTTAGGVDIMDHVNVGNITSYTLTASLTPGVTYYYKVSSNISTSCDERMFTVTSGPPVNDNCSGALVASSFPYFYSQTNAVNSTNGNGFVSSCVTSMNDGLWFKFTGNGSKIIVAIRTTELWAPLLAVYSGNCGNLSCIDINAYSEGASVVGRVMFDSVAGTEYYVNVGNRGMVDLPEGNFDISITSQAPLPALGTNDIDIDKKQNLKIYPNPFTEILNISDISKVSSVSITDLSGRLIKTIENPSVALQLIELKQGMYLITLHMKDGSKQVFKSIKR